ncbi:glycoside hydrolase family 47 protein [Cylindrobasidium torrendii FP15055 ss-10]|uniref:alpha-1,2-Mannosidase n=1 Tax=Cylindrobasidium torrendii FP15055 ss-10 TaxID=1314674 RepID=A0A0D7BCR2_9AGAR|nr:glycoside hydrolase family 47 protein [Cylindrobasidium torrendii FP15055 ss-10]
MSLPPPVSLKTVKSYASLRRSRSILIITAIVGCVWYSFDFFHHPGTSPYFSSTDDLYNSPLDPALPPRPDLPLLTDPDDVTSDTYKANRIREAFVHTYSNYLEHAFPNDELRPLTGRNASTMNGWGVTMYDALDTAYLMHLPQYIDHAADYFAKAPESLFYLKPNQYAPFFETVIRYVGGLLSAYAFTERPIFLEKADELGKLLLPVFDTLSGLPMYGVSTFTGNTRAGWMAGALLAESVSCQLEYKYLAHLVNKPEYFHKVENVMKVLEAANDNAHPDSEDPQEKGAAQIKHMQSKGVFPTVWDVKTGTPKTQAFSAGAFADSAHEYFLKQYLLTAKSEPRSLALYLDAVDAILEHLTFHSSVRDFIYVTDISAPDKPSHTFEHLTCFVGGMLKLGAAQLDLPADKKQLHEWAATGLAETCWMMYADMPTGLSPDEIAVDKANVRPWLEVLAEAKRKGSDKIPGTSRVKPQLDASKRGYRIKRGDYILRPEALETWYIMWKLGDGDHWKERAWATFMAMENVAKTKYGYACVTNVDKLPKDVTLKDELPSYFLAETLKYPYLMFDNTVDLSFDEWVFNTEAHPLPVFKWNDKEKKEYNIPL